MAGNSSLINIILSSKGMKSVGLGSGVHPGTYVATPKQVLSGCESYHLSPGLIYSNVSIPRDSLINIFDREMHFDHRLISRNLGCSRAEGADFCSCGAPKAPRHSQMYRFDPTTRKGTNRESSTSAPQAINTLTLNDAANDKFSLCIPA